MRLVVDKFEVFTDKKLKKPLKVVLISDTHVAKKKILFENLNLKRTLFGIKKIKDIDFFVLGGDYVNTTRDFSDERTLNFFTEFLKSLAEIAPVIMVKGNHDYYFRTKRADEIYENFGKIKNVTYVDNKQLDFLGIKITGFSPTKEAYHATKYGRHAQIIAREQFINQHFKLGDDDFNLILTHSPLSLSNKIMEKSGINFYKRADVILSGHMHNGLLTSFNPEFLVKILRKAEPNSRIRKLARKYADMGIWYVYRTAFLIRECRGARFFGKGSDDVYLPSSKTYSEINLTHHRDEALQITTKGVNKYAVIPFFTGRPSIVELKISPCKTEN